MKELKVGMEVVGQMDIGRLRRELDLPWDMELDRWVRWRSAPFCQ